MLSCLYVTWGPIYPFFRYTYVHRDSVLSVPTIVLRVEVCPVTRPITCWFRKELSVDTPCLPAILTIFRKVPQPPPRRVACDYTPRICLALVLPCLGMVGLPCASWRSLNVQHPDVVVAQTIRATCSLSWRTRSRTLRRHRNTSTLDGVNSGVNHEPVRFVRCRMKPKNVTLPRENSKLPLTGKKHQFSPPDDDETSTVLLSSDHPHDAVDVAVVGPPGLDRGASRDSYRHAAGAPERRTYRRAFSPNDVSMSKLWQAYQIW